MLLIRDGSKVKGRIRNWIWIRIKVISWIRIRTGIEVISWIRIRIDLQMTSQNVRNMSLYEHFFKVFSLYLEARIRIWIRIKVMRIRKIPSGFKLGMVPYKSGFRNRIRIRIGSVFNRAGGSGFGFGIRIRIQEGKNDPQQ